MTMDTVDTDNTTSKLDKIHLEKTQPFFFQKYLQRSVRKQITPIIWK